MLSLSIDCAGRVTLDGERLLPLCAGTASEVQSIVDSLQADGKLPANLPTALKQKMAASLRRYFGRVSADKIRQFTDKATQVVQDTLRTVQEQREGGGTATVGLNPATGRTVLTKFIEDTTGGMIGRTMNVGFFERIAREVVQGGAQHVLRNWDQERVDDFPALELHRLFDREVPRGSERDPAGEENGWDYRWPAACEEAGDDDALAVFQETGRMVALKSSGVWQALGDGAGGYDDTLGNDFEPFAFNSGVGCDELSLEETLALGLMQRGEVAKPAKVDFATLFDLPDDLEARCAAYCAALSAQSAALQAEQSGHDFHGNQWTKDTDPPGEPSGKLKHAVLVVNGKRYRAGSHILAAFKLIQEQPDLDLDSAEVKEGFETESGHFMDRDQAAKYVGKQKRLSSEEALLQVAARNGRLFTLHGLEAAEAGHPFYGNQWTRGTGISLKRTGEGKEARWVTQSGGDMPEHAKKLGIPPAWKNVEVAPGAEHDLQAIGEDAKGRTQRIYSDAFVQRQADAKFSRISELMDKRDKVFAQNEANLHSEDPAVRENAACMKLVQQTGVRPGSDTDTKAEKQAYGATTLQGRHVVVGADGGVRLKFTGKKGVALDIPVEDKDTAKMLVERKEAAGDHGKLFDTDDAGLRDYSHTLDGGGFKPKDFRTLKGTETAVAEAQKFPAPKTFKDYKKQVMEVAKRVAAKLGNTPAIALQSYIAPHVFLPWKNGLEAA